MKHKFKKHGFSMVGVLMMFMLVSLAMAATIPLLFTKSDVKTNTSSYTTTCIVDEGAADLDSKACIGAISGCRRGLKKDCNTLFSYADAYQAATYKVAKYICDQSGGDKACDFLTDECAKDSDNCDITGNDDLNYYLNLDNDDSNAGRAYIETLGTQYYNQSMTDFNTNVNTICAAEWASTQTLGTTACAIVGWVLQTYSLTFATAERAMYSEEDDEAGTDFDTGVVTLMPGVVSDISDRVWCWGRGEYGELGDGTTITDRYYPVSVSGEHEFSLLETSGGHHCALDTSGQAWCWGRNINGQLGYGTVNSQRDYPVSVSGNHIFSKMSVSSGHCCALDTSGQAWCWGSGTVGQLGDGASGESYKVPYPVSVSGNHIFSKIFAAGAQSCGIDTSGQAWCWGYNTLGALGNDDMGVDSPIPVSVYSKSAIEFAELSSGQAPHTCGIDTAGAAWCWGSGTSGQLGNGKTKDSGIPVAVDGGIVFSFIDAVYNRSTGIDTAGIRWYWGGGLDVPVIFADHPNFKSFFYGDAVLCGIDTDDITWCAGSNSWGQVGDGTSFSSSPYVPVAGNHVFSSIKPYYASTCAIESGGGGPGPAYSYITTTSKNNVQDIFVITSVDITETLPDTPATTKWLISFDGGTQWKKMTGACTWSDATTDLSTYDFTTNGNTATQIETWMVNCEPPGTSNTIDFAIDLGSSDGTTLPELDDITVNFYPE